MKKLAEKAVRKQEKLREALDYFVGPPGFSSPKGFNPLSDDSDLVLFLMHMCEKEYLLCFWCGEDSRPRCSIQEQRENGDVNIFTAKGNYLAEALLKAAWKLMEAKKLREPQKASEDELKRYTFPDPRDGAKPL